MSQSTQPASDSRSVVHRVVLIERADELSKIAEILDELGVPFERAGRELPGRDQLDAAGLVIASAERLVEAGPPHLSSWPTTLVSVRNPSKTLTAHLHRIGVSMILCQPIHPQALRLLLLHSTYRGPERRRRKRTPIGHPIRVGAGFFKTKATLLELSPAGARLELARAPESGTPLRLILGKELTHGRPIKLKTKVRRLIDPPLDSEPTQAQIGVEILDPAKHRDAILSILDRHSDGPAVWREGFTTAKGRACGAPNAKHTAASTGEDATAHAPSRPSVEGDAVMKDELPDPECRASADEDSDRRSEMRIPYTRRIIALNEQAARVLVARDLSAGGMRVVSDVNVALDDVLRVALHCGSQMEPVVVTARVLRDDEDNGLVLGFEGLEPEQRIHIEKIIAEIGPIRGPADQGASDGRGNSLVLAEVLETTSSDAE